MKWWIILALPVSLMATLLAQGAGQAASSPFGPAPGTGNRSNAPTATAPATPATTSKPATDPTTMPRGMRQIPTPYYNLFTDVSDQEAREADLRLTRMFEEYQRRTASFAAPVKDKMPFYLFRREDDYHKAGGPPKSGGVYIQDRNGKRLMAIAGEHTDDATWATIQHEGFHQFMASAIKFELPPWVNEGMAEYFAEAMWTGDGFVVDLISTSRLTAVRRGIRNGFIPFKQFMNLSADKWIDNLRESNYDQAWSMVYFLANGDNGKYQTPFIQYMTAVSKGIDAAEAWSAAFGNDSDAFQLRYAQFWMNMPDHPTQVGFIKALVQTETSFLARAFVLKQKFPDAPTFLAKYQPPDFIASRDLWLPPKLFTQFSDVAPDLGKWSFRGQNLVLETPDGATYVGSFAVANGKVAQVVVNLTPGGGGR